MQNIRYSISNARLARSRALTGILESIIASLELTEKQRDSVRETYVECGTYLGQTLGLQSHLADIFPQGSMRLGTVIRPQWGITEVFDLDVVFRIARLREPNWAESYRNAVGQHLKAKYNGIVKPLPKGWRLDYSDERGYYLDVIPAMDSSLGGEVIAITDAAAWKDSNPRGYAGGFFDPIAELRPKFEKIAMLEEGTIIANSASIEPLPQHTDFKSPLQRITQISKRHRDYYFNKKTNRADVSTPSIVLTTMLTLAYRKLVLSREFSSGYELLLACAEDMPNHIERRIDKLGVQYWCLPNPSLPSENLIEKWRDPRHESGFRDWHSDYVTFLHQLLEPAVVPRALLTDAFGTRAIDKAYAGMAETLTQARAEKRLTVDGVTSFGLSLGLGNPVSSTHVLHGQP